LLWIATSRVDAQEQRATLQVERGPRLRGCPSDASLARAVAARLGYDPFQGGVGIAVRAHIEARGRGLTASVEARAEDGALLGRRELSSEHGDCEELARALALAISVAIDPFVLTRSDAEVVEPAPRLEAVEGALSPPPYESSSPAVAPIVPPAPAAPPRASARAPASPHLALTLDVLVGYGAVPSVRPAGALSLWWRASSRLGLEAELRYDGPGEAAGARGGAVRASAVSGRVYLCAGPTLWGLCAGSAQGLLLASGSGVDRPARAVGWVPAASAFFYVSWPRWPRHLLQLRVGADTPLRRVALEVNSVDAWSTPRVCVWGGVGFGFRVP
jgi:hypothetical protein